MPYVAPSGWSAIAKPQSRPKTAFEMAKPLAWRIQRLGIGHRHKRAVFLDQVDGRRDGVLYLSEKILAANLLGNFPKRGGNHQGPQVWAVSRFIRADKVFHPQQRNK